MSNTTTTSAAASTSAAGGLPQLPGSFKIVGVILAVLSGLLIGSSFVFKKKGLLRSQAGGVAGEGVAYLKSPMWWTGMTMMILGEFCNFAAYAFVPAVIVTPLGALSVVICAVLSSIFLNEKLSFFGWIGCGLSIVGSVIIALNGPTEQSVGQISEFKKLFLAPGFLVWTGVLIVASIVIIIFFIPKYGKTSMLWCIFVCSMIGGLSVSTTTGLGGAIVTSIFQHDNQFKNYFIYILIVFVIITLLTEVYYLNMALALFNTVMVTPTYYVIFTFFTLVTSVVLFQGLHSTVVELITVVMGFLVICAGIIILQMSKVDPTKLKTLDRRSTMLLQASRSMTEHAEKSITGMEDPGMDALRGTFGAVGSIIRARSARRMSQSSRGTALSNARQGLPRHQLYDPPVRQPGTMSGVSEGSELPIPKDGLSPSIYSTGPPRTPTIKFTDQDLAHYYRGPGEPGEARHERLAAHGWSHGEPSSRHHSMITTTTATTDMTDTTATTAGSGTLYASPSLLPGNLPSSAPPRDHTFYNPSREDPFAGSPSTAAVGGNFAHSHTYSYDDEPPRGSFPQRSPRKYPKAASHGGDDDDDKEESVSLVRNPLEEDSRESELESESEMDFEPPPNGGIRLLSSSTTRI
ncbi:hypothetical protein M422DRAFT_32046 [Sphaerobolus stellatus SS14]|uniref:Magnesium transporter n=1 Tax=Sphaerobolus stellatus (strain SS14) TaxID=990650 RepID=A0A0C9VRL1_SPHS4|nr:hypothetical protein M422DRAFT_32046 [Sphaerobolus stellatus SS14]